ncbi:MAG: GTP-dependent dephospho-CoA kinase [Thermoplasmata archaeon]|jgi:uncharacterized protein (UPF0218 family)|nr:GTP-dependent dephospho-CoA kinase [Thermoplasmata archaeon]
MQTSAPADLRPPRRYVLPDGLRGELAGAFGPIVQSAGLIAALEGADIVLAVGDVVSLTLKTLGVTPRLFVCDYQTQRGLPGKGSAAAMAAAAKDAANDKTLYELELGTWGELSFRVRNPAASITREAWDAIRLGLQHDEGPVRVVVEGEEDLLGIPCFLEAPNGSVVLYGMPNQGVVVVRVDAAFKARVAALLAKFTRE